MGVKKDIKLIIDGKRIDGRDYLQLRNISMKVGVLEEADGSAYIEWGKNKILAGVFGPKEALPKHLADMHKATLRCIYSMSTFASLEEHGRMGPNRRSIEISKVIREALENITLTEKFPNTIIDVYIIVLQAEGGTRVASLTAACLALMNAGIPVKMPLAAISAGKVDGQLVLDLGKEEDNYGQADMPVGYTKNGDIVLLQADGLLKRDEIEKLLDYTWQGAQKLFEEQRKAIEEAYTKEMEKKLKL
ncbi:MAG: exosome complex exonuclease Rrp41 [Candidatus Anstonellales archaeon]